MKMDERVKHLWTEALSSGQYAQGRDHLRTEEGYCCLGVLCDLHAREHGIEWVLYTYMHTYIDQDSKLPDEVLEWAGLNPEQCPLGDCHVFFTLPGSLERRVSYLSGLNDSRGLSFQEIAKLIEEQL